jgi:hypothetical protein
MIDALKLMVFCLVVTYSTIRALYHFGAYEGSQPPIRTVGYAYILAILLIGWILFG